MTASQLAKSYSLDSLTEASRISPWKRDSLNKMFNTEVGKRKLNFILLSCSLIKKDMKEKKRLLKWVADW